MTIFNKNIDIEVDGGINNETAKLVKEAGANILVAGEQGEHNVIELDFYNEKIKKLKRLLQVMMRYISTKIFTKS